MTTAELLSQFSNPETIHILSTSDKMTAGLVTTVLGMGITFSALVILLFIISWMNKLLNPGPKQGPPPSTLTTEPSAVVPDAAGKRNESDDHEVVAAITTALAMTLKTSASNIVIRNIEKIEDNSPAWNRAGIIEQMNSRL
jgi:sodium pump decarboxylase gamma subunit